MHSSACAACPAIRSRGGRPPGRRRQPRPRPNRANGFRREGRVHCIMRIAWVVALELSACRAPRGESAGTPFGAWSSPLSSAVVSQETRDLAEPTLTPDGVYWLESQPDGHNALLVRRPDGTTSELVPGADVRTEVHAYGGGSYAIDGRRIVYTDARDQRLYIVDGEVPTRAITPPGKAWFAGCQIDHARDRALCVRDDASGGGMPVDAIAVVCSRQDLRAGDLLPGRGRPDRPEPISTDARRGQTPRPGNSVSRVSRREAWLPQGSEQCARSGRRAVLLSARLRHPNGRTAADLDRQPSLAHDTSHQPAPRRMRAGRSDASLPRRNGAATFGAATRDARQPRCRLCRCGGVSSE